MSGNDYVREEREGDVVLLTLNAPEQAQRHLHLRRLRRGRRRLPALNRDRPCAA